MQLYEQLPITGHLLPAARASRNPLSPQTEVQGGENNFPKVT